MELTNNEVLKMRMRTHQIPIWKLAKSLLMGETTCQRKLRNPLSDDDYKMFVEVLDRLIEEKNV